MTQQKKQSPALIVLIPDFFPIANVFSDEQFIWKQNKK